MERYKEIGYDLTNILYLNLSWFEKLWNETDSDIKDKIVNEFGKTAILIVASDIKNKQDDDYEKLKETNKL